MIEILCGDSASCKEAGDDNDYHISRQGQTFNMSDNDGIASNMTSNNAVSTSMLRRYFKYVCLLGLLAFGCYVFPKARIIVNNGVLSFGNVRHNSKIESWLGCM